LTLIDRCLNDWKEFTGKSLSCTTTSFSFFLCFLGAIICRKNMGEPFKEFSCVELTRSFEARSWSPIRIGLRVYLCNTSYTQPPVGAGWGPPTLYFTLQPGRLIKSSPCAVAAAPYRNPRYCISFLPDICRRRRRRRFTSFQPHQADQTMTHRK
jgi:hypothetical protein